MGVLITKKTRDAKSKWLEIQLVSGNLINRTVIDKGIGDGLPDGLPINRRF